jgi:hypothetical protein
MFKHFLGDREQGQMQRQLVFAMNVDFPGEMTAATRGMTTKVMETKTGEIQKMIRTAASDMVQGVQGEMNAGITMMIEGGSQVMIDTKNHEGSGDGRDRGQWTQGMVETKSDVEWDDIPWHIPSSAISSGFQPRFSLGALEFGDDPLAPALWAFRRMLDTYYSKQKCVDPPIYPWSTTFGAMPK